MNELEELKARAAERFRRLEIVARNSGRRLHATADCDQAEADLDRAIAIAEGENAKAIRTRAAYELTVEERDKAIAAALALRDIVRRDREVQDSADGGRGDKVLAETAWLEEHR